MGTPSAEAVIAGSREFALALLAPLTERVGTRPRVAADAAQAIALCSGGALLVVEFQGEGSLRTIQDLVLEGTDLKIVAAVPEAHAAAEGALRALGIRVARWDGNPLEVVAAVERKLAGAQAAPATAPARVQPPVAKLPAHPKPPGIAVVAPVAAPPSQMTSTGDPSTSVPAAPPASGRATAAGLFDDLVDDDFDVDISDEDSPLLAPSYLPSEGPWPTNVPGSVEAADALGRGLAGQLDPPGAPFACVADVLSGLSDIERAVFAGEPHPFDTAPIRRAAVMRVRVAMALATIPAAGASVDRGAVSMLLAEIDGLLSDVNALAQSAPPEAQLGLEQVRNALVKEAIDFSEATHRATPSEPMSAAEPAGLRGRATQSRMVSVASKEKQEIERAQARRHRIMYVSLAVAIAAAAMFHAYRWVAARPNLTGAPDDACTRSRSSSPGGDSGARS